MPFNMTVDIPTVLEEFRRRHWLLMEFGGELFDLWVRKTAGPRCFCYNDVDRQGEMNCSSCYGVWYEGGYELNAAIQIRIDDVPRAETPSEGGLIVMATVPFWALCEQLIRNGDVLVRQLNNKRYVVEDIKYRIYQGIMTYQQGSAKEIETEHVIYELGV